MLNRENIVSFSLIITIVPPELCANIIATNYEDEIVRGRMYGFLNDLTVSSREFSK